MGHPDPEISEKSFAVSYTGVYLPPLTKQYQYCKPAQVVKLVDTHA